jgi:branched-chain amino acid transport system substrate-binding protein
MSFQLRARAAAAALLLGIASSAWAQPVRVGLIGPFTGGSEDFGNSMRIGAEIAVNEINSVGGYMGRKLEIVERDDQGNPAVGRKAAEDLIAKDKVDFAVGYCNTGVAMKSIDVFQAAKRVLVVPCSQGTAVTRAIPPKESYIFRVAPADVLNARFLIGEIVDRRHLKKVAIFADTTPYGQGGVNDLTAELARRQLTPVYTARFDLGVADLTSEMRAAKAAGADAIVTYAVGPEQATAAKSRLGAGVTAPFFAPWPLSFRSTFEQAGQNALEGTMMVQTIIQDTYNERRTSFLAQYSRLSQGKRIGSLMAAAQAYDSVHLLLWAMFQTHGDSSGAAIKAALEDLQQDFRGVVTSYSKPFSPADHEAISENMMWLGVWRKGELHHYYAEDARIAGFVRRKAGS